MATESMATALPRPRFERRPVRRWLIIGVLVLAALAIEGVAAARLAGAVHAPLTVDQQLAAAQGAVPFPIRQPSWLPAGVALQSVFADRCPASTCGAGYSHVHLNYSSTAGISYALDEGTTPINYSFETQGADGKPQQMVKTSSTVQINGVAGELDLYSGMQGGTTSVQDAVLSWSQGVVHYALVANAMPGTAVSSGDMQQIAESM